MKVILASASPRRQDILKQMGISFEVKIDSSPEEDDINRLPQEIAAANAQKKCGNVLMATLAEADSGLSDAPSPMGGTGLYFVVFDAPEEKLQKTLIIAADTVVALDNRLMGKPRDAEEAGKMLTLLSGRVHQVYTAVSLALIDPEKQVPIRYCNFTEETQVEFYPLEPKEIESYIATKEPFDKAGSYGIQGKAAIFVKGIHGDYWNVVGLPAGRLYREMKLLEKNI